MKNTVRFYEFTPKGNIYKTTYTMNAIPRKDENVDFGDNKVWKVEMVTHNLQSNAVAVEVKQI